MSERLDASFGYDIRWTAIKLLENDKIVWRRMRQKAGPHCQEILDLAHKLRQDLSQRFNDDLEIVMTEERYGFIAGIIKEVLTASRIRRADISRTIDLVLTNRFLGFPIFIFFIWAMFQMTFTLGAYPMGWIEHGVSLFSSTAAGLLPDSWFRGLLVDGVIAGIGSVIVFLPNILILFFCIALFEDTGYMSRAAFLMDKIMHLIGLHGKSFIPMLMGFGCSVPAVMAARTLESQKDRILTILITPFMSCSAKLPVYIVLAGTFFGAKAGNVIFGVYLAGIVLAVITGRLLRSTLLRGADAPFVMELPPYRAPMFKSLLIHMWDRGKIFLRKMGGIILIGSVVVWCLTAFPRPPHPVADASAGLPALDDRAGGVVPGQNEDPLAATARQFRLARMEQSYMGRIGHLLEPVFTPIGIDWRGGVALLSGFVAKEIVVSTLGVLHAVDDPEASEALGRALERAGMTPLSALAMLFFVLLYLPCLATVTAIRRETGSMRWLIFSVIFNTSVAWLAAFAIYQGGRLLGYQ
jgi:ferrous iron transport protein B